MNISRALVDLRKKAAMKQIAAAEKIGISQTYLSQIESGNKIPSVGMLEDICKAYGFPTSLLYWKAMTIDDVSKNKKKIFKELYPVVNNLIDQFF